MAFFAYFFWLWEKVGRLSGMPIEKRHGCRKVQKRRRNYPDAVSASPRSYFLTEKTTYKQQLSYT